MECNTRCAPSGQVADQVGKVIHFHAFCHGDQFIRIHAIDAVGAHLVVELNQYLALDFRIDETPDNLAFGGRQGFQQRSDFRRVQRIDQTVRMTHRSLRQ
jgi:hypothetical protein